MKTSARFFTITALGICLALCGCGATAVYHDPNMDFSSIQRVAVLPFANLTRDSLAAERVRDSFSTRLLATGAVYVVPAGETARGISDTGIGNPAAPTPEEIVRLGKAIRVEAVITGVVREYGEVRSGATAANTVSISMQMIEAQTGKIVWTASTTKGGVGAWERLFGGGGRPMNDVTEKAVDDLIEKLFK